MKARTLIAAAILSTAGAAALAATPAEIQAGYAAQARRASPGFTSFSAVRGEQFFKSTHGGEWSCTSCHTATPTSAGKHAKTGKAITPLAPSGDPDRFTDAARTEKWFRRNCNDVAGRECTALEKGDVMAFLMLFGKK